MAFEGGGNGGEGEERDSTDRIVELVEEMEEDLEDRLSGDLDHHDDAWPTSVAFVDQDVVKSDWWDAEPPENDEHLRSDVVVFREAVRFAGEDLRAAVSGIGEEDPDTADGRLVQALSATAELHAAADDFDRQLSVAHVVYSFAQRAKQAVKQAYNKVKNWITKKLKPLIKQASNQLWKLIKKGKNLESWTVGGEVGVNVLGFQGNANVSLTFGP